MVFAGIAMLVLALGAVLLVLVSGLLGDEEAETKEGPAEPRLDGALAPSTTPPPPSAETLRVAVF